MAITPSLVSEFDLKFIKPVGRRSIVTTEIWIDGEHLDEPHPIDIFELVRSLKVAGEYSIFTCGCGSAGCADIEGVKVSVSKDTITWRLKRPLSKANFKSHSDWPTQSKEYLFTFNRKQLTQEIKQEIIYADYSHPWLTEYSPTGFDRSSMSQLLTRVASL
jgi:hypothetical protein